MDAMLNESEDFPQVLDRAKMNVRETVHIRAILAEASLLRLTLDEMSAELSDN
jgi:hypothetical protein